MAKLDARFTQLDTLNQSNEVIFDRSNTTGKLLAEPKCFDSENTKKFQVSFNMGNGAVSGNKSLLEQYRDRTEIPNENHFVESRMENNQTTNITQMNTHDKTPMYSKNPNMTNNKIDEILELSKNENDKRSNQTIEPSPSGITRCYVKYDDAANLQQQKLVQQYPMPKTDTVQVNYLKQMNHLTTGTGLVDSGTSPFVILNSVQGQGVENGKENRYQGKEFHETVPSTPLVKPEVIYKNAQTNVNTIELGKEIRINRESNTKQEPRKKLEKSKVVFVNLTPRPNTKSSYNDNNNNNTNNNFNISSNLNENKDNVQSKAVTNEAYTQDDLNTQLKDSAIMSYLDTLDQSGRSYRSNQRQIETPVSAKKSNLYPTERLKSIAEESNKDLYSQNLETNEMLNKRSLSYYDNINGNNNTQMPNTQLGHTNYSETDNTAYNPPLENEYSYKETQMAPQIVENCQHISNQSVKLQRDQINQFPTPNINNVSQFQENTRQDNNNVSTNSDEYDNYKNTKSNGGLKRYNLSTIEEENDDDKLISKSSKTYYDGKRCWTSLASSRSNYDNQNFQLNGVNYEYESSNSDMKVDYDNSVDTDSVDLIIRKNENHVNIKLPDISIERTVKERQCQNCCFKFFLILISLIAIAILIYFIAFDEYARNKLFSAEMWKNVYSRVTGPLSDD